MSASRRQEMHVNSLAAWRDGNVELFSKREVAVLRCLDGHDRTDREVMTALGFTDMNSVRPRITELIKDGVLEEVADVTDPVTGKQVRLVAIAKQQLAQSQLELTIASCPN